MKILSPLIVFILILSASALAGADSIKILYTEERPMEVMLNVSIEDENISVDTKEMLADCDRPWDASCWKKDTKHSQLSGASVTRITNAINKADFSKTERAETVAPGSKRIHLVVMKNGKRTIDQLVSEKQAEKTPGFDAIRQAIIEAIQSIPHITVVPENNKNSKN